MFVTSGTFNKRIRESGKRKTVVDVVTSTGVVLLEDVVVESGSVNVDRNAAIRRSGSILIPDQKLVPSFIEQTLLPYGTEIRIRQGVVYGDGTEELIPLGTFILDTTSWQEQAGPVPKIEFFDRSMIPERAGVGPVQDWSGWTPKNVIIWLIHHFWPELTVDFEDDLIGADDPNPGGTTFTSGNCWAVLQQQARKIGAEIYFDVLGNPVVRKIPVLNDAIQVADTVWEANTGSTGILINASRSITRDEVYNSVYVTGVATNDVVPTGEAFNDDTTSPTYRHGPFRLVGIKINDNSLSYPEQCKALAELKLREYMKLAQTVDFGCVPNPALEAGNFVLLSYEQEDSQIGMLESFSVPIGKGSMSGKCSVARF